MKRLADRIFLTPAVLIAAFRLASPAVKFSITGTRAKACRAKNVTTTPDEDGSSTATRSSASVMPAILRPSTKAARIRPV